jgi:hypothetical protein
MTLVEITLSALTKGSVVLKESCHLFQSDLTNSLLGRLLEQGFGKAELSKRFSRRRPGEHSTADANKSMTVWDMSECFKRQPTVMFQRWSEWFEVRWNKR